MPPRKLYLYFMYFYIFKKHFFFKYLGVQLNAGRHSGQFTKQYRAGGAAVLAACFLITKKMSLFSGGGEGGDLLKRFFSWVDRLDNPTPFDSKSRQKQGVGVKIWGYHNNMGGVAVPSLYPVMGSVSGLTLGLASSCRSPQEYEELERDMPGIDSPGVEQHFQPTESLWNF